MSPVPQHRSSTWTSGRERIEENIRAVRFHHKRSTFIESTWLARSYLGAIELNMSRTATDADDSSLAPAGAAPTTRSAASLWLVLSEFAMFIMLLTAA